MKPLNVIYIIRIGLGVLAAVVAAMLVNLKVGNPLINGITIGLAVYLLTYYLLKMQFLNKVDKPSKILSMGIGVYFITFIMCWVLLITPFLAPPTAAFTVETAVDDRVVNTAIAFDASASTDDSEIVAYAWNFGDDKTGENMVTSHTYNEPGEYIVTLIVVDDHGISSSTSQNINVTASS